MENFRFPKKSQFYIDEYTFEEEVKRPREIKYEKLSQEELADVCKELRKKVQKHEQQLEEELQAKLKHARMLTVLEMHLNIEDKDDEGNHQNASLEHATTWLAKYGPEDGEGLLTGVNSIHRKIITQRLREVMGQAQNCGTRPCCKHVLTARPALIQPGEILQFEQVALGLPLKHFMETLPADVLTDDKKIWKHTDGTLRHHALHDERIPREELDKMSYTTLYFRAQTTSEFITARKSVIDNLQREAHHKKDLKVCKEVPQSNLRKTINVIRKAIGDEDMETVSPTKSVMSSMAVAPRPVKPGSSQLPRHKNVSMVKLYENPEASAGAVMSGALKVGSKTLSAAAGNVDRAKRHRASASGDQKAVSFQNTNLEQIRENDILSPQPKPLPVRRERIHRELVDSSKKPSTPSWAAGTSSSQARKATTASSGSSRRREESPARPSGRRAQSPLIPATRTPATKTPESARRSTKSRVSSSSASPAAHRLRLGAGITPSTSRTQKTTTTPGTTPQVERARSSTTGSSNLSSRLTVWPGPNAPDKSSKAREDKALENKGKGKAKEEKPATPKNNPFLSEYSAGLPSDWKRQPSEFPSSGKTGGGSSSKRSQPTPTPVPRPPSSVYSAYPPAETEKPKFRGVTVRNREAREDLLPEEPEPVTPPKAPSHAPTIPAGVDLGNVAGGLGHGFNPGHFRGGSTSTLGTIPPGVDLDTAGGTASRYVPPRQNWDSSKNPQPTVTTAQQPKKEPRKRYHFPVGALGPMLERTPPLGGWASDENTENEEEERGRAAAESRRGRKIITEPGCPKRVPVTVSPSLGTTASSGSLRRKKSSNDLLGGGGGGQSSKQPKTKPPPSLPLSDKRSGATLQTVSSASVEIFYPDPMVKRFAEAQSAELEGGSDDEWSSRIGLPTTPGATATNLSPAARSFNSPEKPKLHRGRNNRPRGNEKLAVPAERRAHSSRSGSSRSRSRSAEPPISPITEEPPLSAPAPVSPISPSLIPTPLTGVRDNKFRDHIDRILSVYADEGDFTVKSPTPPPPPKDEEEDSRRMLPYEYAGATETVLSTRPFPPKNWALHPRPEPEDQKRKAKQVEEEEEEEGFTRPEPFWPEDSPEKQEKWRLKRQRTIEREERQKRERLRREIEAEREQIRLEEEEKRRQKQNRQSQATTVMSGESAESRFFNEAIGKVQRGEW